MTKDDVWRVAQAARKAINLELYDGRAPKGDSTALSEVGDSEILGIADGARFTIGGKVTYEVVFVPVPTSNPYYPSVEDTRRALSPGKKSG